MLVQTNNADASLFLNEQPRSLSALHCNHFSKKLKQ